MHLTQVKISCETHGFTRLTADTPVHDAPIQRAKVKEPESFNGKRRDDAGRFLQQMGTYLKVCGVPRENWPAIASTHFADEVVQWWETHMAALGHPAYTWEQFSAL